MTTMWNARLKDDPLAWVMYAFPWGQKGTPLEHVSGPRKWQCEEFSKIAAHIAENKARVARNEDPQVYRLAVSSGRGPGKSAFIAMLELWFMSCVVGGTSVVTANTDSQLTDKTFGEIGKWQTLCLSGYWFDKIQKKLKPTEWFSKLLKDHLKIDEGKYYAAGVLWDEDNPDAFAGEHSQIGFLLVYDEASGIPPRIWDVSEGFFTDKTIYRFWLVFSNPRRNTGRFFECFHRHRNFWNTRKIDARTVEGIDRSVYEVIIQTHGVDSDEAKIEVYGEFPQSGDRQFISRTLVAEAQTRVLERFDNPAGLILGVDPARFGADDTVMMFRQGRDARSIPPTILHGADNMKVVNVITDLIEKYAPDAVCIDAGAGAGIIDRLKQMNYKIHEVNFGSVPNDSQYADHKTELWSRLKEWLPSGMINDTDDLRDDLCGPEYDFTGREDKLKLESKEKMQKRGLSSPDHADALALTFHVKLARTDQMTSKRQNRKSRMAKGLDYKIFG